MPGKDRIKRAILGDALQPDMRHSLVNEAASRPLLRILGTEKVISGRQKSLTRNRHCHAARVSCYPAPPPLLRNIGRGAAPAGRIKHEIARITGHEHTTLDHLRARLYDISLGIDITRSVRIIPRV